VVVRQLTTAQTERIENAATPGWALLSG
jgi:hypothetical protein